MKKSITLTEVDAVAALKAYIDDCDGDELARILGNIFGGFCTTDNGEMYVFEPTENYCGEFDSIVEKLKKKRVKNA